MVINPQYIASKVVIRNALQQNNIVQLRDFLTSIPRLKKGIVKFLPDQYKYTNTSIPSLLKQELGEFLRQILNKNSRIHQAVMMKFNKGDYTLLHDSVKKFNGTTVLYDLFTTNGAKAVFQNKREKFEIIGHRNTLTIIQGTYQHFFKYINHKQKPRILLLMQWK